MTADNLILLGRVLKNDWDGVDPFLAYILLRDLQEALPRVVAETRSRLPPPEPAFKCQRCGATAHYIPAAAHFQPHVYERQAEAFRAAHTRCPLSIDGGGI